MKTSKLTLGMIGVALAGLILTAAPAEARVRHRSRPAAGQDYTQGGFQLYGGFGGQGYQIEDNDYNFLNERSSDGMFFLGAAVGLGSNVSLFLEGAGSEHATDIGDVSFGYAHLGLKFAPNADRRRSWQPYGKISAGGMFLFEEDSYDHAWHHRDHNGYTGPSVALAIGVDKFLSRHAALYGEVGMMMGRFDTQVVNGRDYDLADDIGVTSARLQIGLRLRL